VKGRWRPWGISCCRCSRPRTKTLGPTLEAALATSREISAEDPFLKLQRRLVLARCGVVDPGCINDALSQGAYQQLQAVLAADDPSAVIETVRRSGLRGRGGAGYPTGLKWATVAAMPGARKVVVCNADEGDPGAFMDRTLMEGDPHTLLEGMAIAAFAVGAQQGYIYVRAEYPLAIERLRTADRRGRNPRLVGNGDQGEPFQLCDRAAGGRRRLCVRRGNSADPFD